MRRAQPTAGSWRGQVAHPGWVRFATPPPALPPVTTSIVFVPLRSRVGDLHTECSRLTPILSSEVAVPNRNIEFAAFSSKVIGVERAQRALTWPPRYRRPLLRTAGQELCRPIGQIGAPPA